MNRGAAPAACRVDDQAYTDDNVFLTLAHSPAVLELFVHWAVFMDTGVSRLDPATMELCRLRMAALH